MNIVKSETRAERTLNQLVKENRCYQWLHFILLGGGLLLSLTLWSLIPFLVAYVTSFLSLHNYWAEAKKEKANVWSKVMGDRSTIHLLSNLNDDWYLLNDVTFEEVASAPSRL